MMTSIDELPVRRFWSEVWCDGRGDVVHEIFHPDALMNGEPADLAAFAAMVETWFQKFPDFTATIDEIFAAGDRVVSRVTYRGTHHGTWAGLPATGRSFASIGLDVFRIRDGRIAEHWHATDHAELIDQLGGVVVPGPD